MNAVAVSRIRAVAPDSYWDKGLAELAVEAAAPIAHDLAIDALFCAGTDASAAATDVAALFADRLGLRPSTAIALDCADVSGAAALQLAWHHVRSGASKHALVVAAAKVSDGSENERLALMDRTLDADADLARGIDFTTQAGLLAGHYCRTRGCDANVFAETTAANFAAWSKHAMRPMPSAAELRRDLPVSPPLVRSDFAQLLDGACALVLSAADVRAPHPIVEAVHSANDVVSIWDRKDPLAFAAVDSALARMPEAATRWFEVDAGSSVAQLLAEEGVRRCLGAAGTGAPDSGIRVNSRGGNFGRGRVYGASALYQLADICESAARGESAHLLAVSGLGSHVFVSRVAGPQ